MSEQPGPRDARTRIADLITARTATSAGDWVSHGDAPEFWGDLQLLAGPDLDDDLVYRAWDPELMRRIVVKLLPTSPELATQVDTYMARALALATIAHRHLLGVLGAEVHAGRAGLRLELVEGYDLAHLVRRGGPLPAADVTRVAAEIGSALAAVHAAGQIHGSVSARHVRTRPDGSLVLMEPSLGEPAAPVRPSVPRGFIACEVLAGAIPNAATDVFGLGATLCYALCGHTPDEAGDVDLEALRPDVAPSLLAAARRAIAVDPAERGSAADAAAAAA